MTIRKISIGDYPVKALEDGGTGAKDVAGAAANLRTIRKSEFLNNGSIPLEFLPDPGQDGIARYDQNGIVPADIVPDGIYQTDMQTIEGPIVAHSGMSHTYTITNYDSFDTWDVSVDKGTVSRNKEVITLNIPTDASGTVTLTVNGEENVITIAPITLSGPTQVVGGYSYTYTITNYNSQATYVVSSSVGSVVRNGASVILTVPSSHTGNIRLYINGSHFDIASVSGVINKPVIAAPTNGSTTVSSNYTFFTGDFSTTPINWTTLTGTEWQISINPNFTSIERHSSFEDNNVTSWYVTGLIVGYTYYVRIRHSGANGNISVWSDPVMFTVRGN